ncbi:hypothetical protein V3C99_012231, partial [Haemonchus contortus]|uniref:Secreted protein n=1 Tax=Haemonchus contortus TaxID=6289 RepID=A0A7I4Y5C5_HAECO
ILISSRFKLIRFKISSSFRTLRILEANESGVVQTERLGERDHVLQEFRIRSRVSILFGCSKGGDHRMVRITLSMSTKPAHLHSLRMVNGFVLSSITSCPAAAKMQLVR